MAKLALELVPCVRGYNGLLFAKGKQVGRYEIRPGDPEAGFFGLNLIFDVPIEPLILAPDAELVIGEGRIPLHLHLAIAPAQTLPWSEEAQCSRREKIFGMAADQVIIDDPVKDEGEKPEEGSWRTRGSLCGGV